MRGREEGRRWGEGERRKGWKDVMCYTVHLVHQFHTQLPEVWERETYRTLCISSLIVHISTWILSE